MMKCCCLIVFIFCTIDVTNGGILSRICLASNGTCGQKGVTCNETFGPEWTYNGKCCNERPCCKSPCVPESCPHGYKLLSNQASSADCYFYGNYLTHWDAAQSSCASTRGAYLWRPNTAQETNDVRNTIANDSFAFWTGANDRDKDGKFTFIIENGPFSLNSLPFGSGSFAHFPDAVHVAIAIDTVSSTWIWLTQPSTLLFDYICEYQRRVCP
ncbi:uncharacterized protein [Mytilus edulis]|uniref:uncharacterized protein n=1 Tax=Mytilus edulis TaxID=6550 RepID=UPI0039F07E93